MPLIGLYSKQESDNQPVTVDVEVVEQKEEEEEMDITVKDKKVEKRSEAAGREKPLSVIQPRRPSLSLLPPPSKAANDQFSDISDASDGEIEKRAAAASSPPHPLKAVSKMPNGVIPTILTPSDQEEKGKLAQPLLPSFDAVRSPQPQIVREEKDAHRGVLGEEAVPDSQPSSPKDVPSASTMRSNLLTSYPNSQVSMGPLGVASLTCNSLQNQRHSYAGSQSAGKTNPSVVSSPKRSDHIHNPLNTLAEMAVERSTQGAHSSRLPSSGSSSSREDESKRDRDTGDSQQQQQQQVVAPPRLFDDKSTDKHRGGHSIPSMVKVEPSSRAATVAYVAPGSSHALSRSSDDTRDSDSSGSGSLSPRTRKTRKMKRKKNSATGGNGRSAEQHEVGKEDAGRMPVTPAMIPGPFSFSVPCQPISPGTEGSAHGDKLAATSVVPQHSMMLPVGPRPGNSSSPIPNRHAMAPFVNPSPPSREKEPSGAGASNKRVITSISGAPSFMPAQFTVPSVLLGGESDKQHGRKRGHDTSNANPNKRPSPSPPSYSHEMDTSSKPLPPLPASLGPLSRSGHHPSTHDLMRRGSTLR